MPGNVPSLTRTPPSDATAAGSVGLAAQQTAQPVAGLDEDLVIVLRVIRDLLPVGAQRRDWKQTLVSDGMVIVRHPELETALNLADRVGMELQMVAS